MILVPENLKIRVTLHGNSKIILHDYEGIYVIDPDDLVNGEPSWNKEDVPDKEGAAKSIWYDKDWNNWKISETRHRGSCDEAREKSRGSCDMMTNIGTADDGLPHEIKPWMNKMGGKRTPPGDIVLEGKLKTLNYKP